MTDFVIADLHFGDSATAARRRALLPGVHDVDGELVRRWNGVVTDTDTVCLLGDVGRGEA
jgi:calcineurin-like phosphoesterase family protein